MSEKSAKIQIKEALDQQGFADLLQSSIPHRQVVSILIRLSYDKDTLIGWRAIKAIGLAARSLVQGDYPFLRETCRKLLWSLSDESGGIGWSAPEILGEIVSADPRRFADLIPLIAGVYDVEEVVFRPGVLYALNRIAAAAPESVVPFQKIIISSLADENPLVRILGLELIGRIWQVAMKSNDWSPEYQDRVSSAVKRLLLDQGESWVYENNDFRNINVGELAAKVIILLN